MLKKKTKNKKQKQKKLENSKNNNHPKGDLKDTISMPQSNYEDLNSKEDQIVKEMATKEIVKGVENFDQSQNVETEVKENENQYISTNNSDKKKNTDIQDEDLNTNKIEQFETPIIQQDKDEEIQNLDIFASIKDTINIYKKKNSNISLEEKRENNEEDNISLSLSEENENEDDDNKGYKKTNIGIFIFEDNQNENNNNIHENSNSNPNEESYEHVNNINQGNQNILGNATINNEEISNFEIIQNLENQTFNQTDFPNNNIETEFNHLDDIHQENNDDKNENEDYYPLENIPYINSNDFDNENEGI